MKHVMLLLALFVSTIASGSAAEQNPFADIATYDRAKFSREVTDCDRLAGHPNDPERVTEGVSEQAMDKPAAIKACHAAVANDAENPRLNYQLARAYGYSGLHAEGAQYRMKALNAGYPQSLFVFGYIRISGWDGAQKDPCYGGELVRRSAVAGRFAGLVGFPHYALTGQFKSCESYPVIDPAELHSFLDAAEANADGYYQRILVRQLKHDVTQTFGK